MSERVMIASVEICTGCDGGEIEFCRCGNTFKWRRATAEELLGIGWTDEEVYGEEEPDDD